MILGIYGAGLFALDIIDHLAEGDLILRIDGENLVCRPKKIRLVIYDSSFTEVKIQRIEKYKQYFEDLRFVENSSVLGECCGVLLCIASDMVVRRKVLMHCKKIKVTWASMVHNTARVSQTSVIGPGTFILPYSTIGPAVTIESHVIVYNYSTVGHESQVGDNVVICPDVSVGGGVSIGSHTLVSTKSFIYPFVHIGRGSIIDPLVAVKKNVPENSLVTNIAKSSNRISRRLAMMSR